MCVGKNFLNSFSFYVCTMALLGACTVIGDLGYRCAGLAYVEETNTLYGSGFDGLYTINDVSNPSDVTLLTGISPYWVANGLAYMTF